MRHRVLILMIVGGVGCASSSLGSTQGRTVVAGGGGESLHIAGDEAKETLLPYVLPRIWATLPAVYDSLGINIGDVDSERHVIGNTDIRVTRQLGKTPLSKYLDCGTGQGFQSADTYMIQMSVLTQLVEEKSGDTRVTTLVQATGKPMAFGNAPVRCTTKYALETLIADGIKARVHK